MDSSQSTTRDSPPVEMLTPRSKVAKMLQEIDDAPTPSPPSSSSKAQLPQRSVQQETVDSLVSSRRSASQSISAASCEADNLGHGVESNDDAIHDIRRPRGRVANRMFAGRKISYTNTDENPRAQGSSPIVGCDDMAPNLEEDDLYSATPLKLSSNARKSAASPSRSNESDKLFVSPARSESDYDDELPSNPLAGKSRLAELVATKRAERQARDREEAQRRERRTSTALSSSPLTEHVAENVDEVQEAEVERIMSDAAPPTRKASKKALLEMERETQRLARQQALAHQMKPKRKFTTSDLFTRFNFRQQHEASERAAANAADSTASSAPNSDGPDTSTKEPVSTPPSSPPSLRPTPLEKQTAIVEQGALSKLVPVRQESLTSLAGEDENFELPELSAVLRQSRIPIDQTGISTEHAGQKDDGLRRGLKLARMGKKAALSRRGDASDDELEIVEPLPRHLRIFDQIKPATSRTTSASSKAVRTLRHLSRIGTYESPPSKKGARRSVDRKTLEAELRARAKAQARRAQLERIAELKAKGIDLQTAEDREMEAELFENLLEKAKNDAIELRKAEKIAMKSIKDGNDVVIASEEDNDDEDYDGSDNQALDSEESDDENIEQETRLVVDAAEDSEEIQESGEEATLEQGDETTDIHNTEHNSPVQPPNTEESIPDESLRRNRLRTVRKCRIITDDDDEELDGPVNQQSAISVDEDTVAIAGDPFAAFNFHNKGLGSSLMSPTQAFQATMQTPTQATQEDSIVFLRNLAKPSAVPQSQDFTVLPGSHTPEDAPTSVVPASQNFVPESQRINQSWDTQQPGTPLPTLHRDASALSETPGWEPTQDPGLPSPWSIVRQPEFMTTSTNGEHDTQTTVRLRVSESPAPSTAPVRKGRLARRRIAVAQGVEDGDAAPPAPATPAQTNAFREMARRRKEALTVAEREAAEQEMKEMMDVQAEESEDEYAGLGGDDHVAPETEDDRNMIDNSLVEVDERALAALYAERERNRQEQETSKLFKDLTTGALRRKQANMYELDEDEDEVALRRRQMRQREEARKRKLLLQDDNVAGLAEGKQSKGKDAFLKAIADDDDEADDFGRLLDDEGEVEAPVTQDMSQSSRIAERNDGPLRETSGNKRRWIDNDEQQQERPPAKERRTQTSAFRRPASMVEVSESVSFLLEEPQVATYGPTALDLSSDDENDGGQRASTDDDVDVESTEIARHNDGGFASNPSAFDAHAMPPPRQPASQRRTAHKSAVVDRLSLKRGSTAPETIVGRTAWASSGPIANGFKAPSLLRRATTNTASIANESTLSRPSLSRENSAGGIRTSGSKRANLAYQARVEERRAMVEAGAKRRIENRAKIAEMRRENGFLDRGLTGRFE